MATVIDQGTRKAPVRVGSAPSRPVLWWSALGAVMLAVIAWSILQWIMGPNFQPAPTGNDPLPAGIGIWIRTLEAISTTAAVLMAWFYAIRPWIKTGRLPWDALFMLACFGMYYQDPIDNYFNFTFTYNAHFTNYSSWAPFIPGWVSPRSENFAEPVLLIGSLFMWLFLGISVLGCWLLNRFKVWLPNAGFIVHVGILFLLVAIFDFVMESIFTHTQIFAYVAVYSPLSLWAGTPYQFPIYESTGVSALATGCALVRYFRNDRGESWFERGVESLAVPGPAKRLLSFLSLFGGLQLMIFVLFFGQYQWFALKADSFAKYPSYQLLEICGQGTPYACPTAEVPMPKRESLAIPPDDPRLSPASRRN